MRMWLGDTRVEDFVTPPRTAPRPSLSHENMGRLGSKRAGEKKKRGLTDRSAMGFRSMLVPEISGLCEGRRPHL